MRGLELSRHYYFEHGIPCIQRVDPLLVMRCAAGLISGGLPSGCGSEVMGYDDHLSRDHNWGPRFFLILEESDLATFGDRLRNVFHDELPDVYQGHQIKYTSLPQEKAHLTTIERLLTNNLGSTLDPQNEKAWLEVDEYRLFELSAGEIFHNAHLPFLCPLAAYREWPISVRLKRLSYAWFAFMQSGQVFKAIQRGDRALVMFYLTKYVNAALRIAFLASGHFAPCNKWIYRRARELRLPNDESCERLLGLDPTIPCGELENRLLSCLADIIALCNHSDLVPKLNLNLATDYSFGPFYAATFAWCDHVHKQLPPSWRDDDPYVGPKDLQYLF